MWCVVMWQHGMTSCWPACDRWVVQAGGRTSKQDGWDAGSPPTSVATLTTWPHTTGSAAAAAHDGTHPPPPPRPSAPPPSPTRSALPRGRLHGRASRQVPTPQVGVSTCSSSSSSNSRRGAGRQARPDRRIGAASGWLAGARVRCTALYDARGAEGWARPEQGDRIGCVCCYSPFWGSARAFLACV